jgi:hypothetical protein
VEYCRGRFKNEREVERRRRRKIEVGHIVAERGERWIQQSKARRNGREVGSKCFGTEKGAKSRSRGKVGMDEEGDK